MTMVRRFIKRCQTCDTDIIGNDTASKHRQKGHKVVKTTMREILYENESNKTRG